MKCFKGLRQSLNYTQDSVKEFFQTRPYRESVKVPVFRFFFMVSAEQPQLISELWESIKSCQAKAVISLLHVCPQSCGGGGLAAFGRCQRFCVLPGSEGPL